MPEHLKNIPNSKEFSKYLHSFMRRKERQYKRKIVQEVASTLTLIVTS